MPVGVYIRTKKVISSRGMLGKHQSESARDKIRKTKTGRLNPMWKGDKVGYHALHNWVKRHFPKPTKCNICQQEKSWLDLANISQDYKRDLVDWEWLCRKCHMIKDGRFARFIKFSSAHLP